MNPLIVAPLFDLFKQVLGGLGLDPEAKARAQTQAFDILQSGSFTEKADHALALAQISVNKAEAESQGIYKGGWRPAIGWVCAGALASQYLVKPWVESACLIVGHPVPSLPGIDEHLWELMGGMLGLGGLRTFEKLRGRS